MRLLLALLVWILRATLVGPLDPPPHTSVEEKDLADVAHAFGDVPG
jgi:hypothetical protein